MFSKIRFRDLGTADFFRSAVCILFLGTMFVFQVPDSSAQVSSCDYEGDWNVYENNDHATSRINTTDFYGAPDNAGDCSGYPTHLDYQNVYAKCEDTDGYSDDYKLYIQTFPGGSTTGVDDPDVTIDEDIDSNGHNNYDRRWTSTSEISREIRIKDSSGTVRDTYIYCWTSDGSGWATQGIVFSNRDTAKVDNPPSASNPSPNNGATGVRARPSISIDASDDYGISSVVFYRGDGTQIGSVSPSQNSGTFSTEYTAADGHSSTYEWYAEVTDGQGQTYQTSTYSFTTEENTAPSVSNPEPFDNEQNVQTQPSISVDYYDANGDSGTLTYYTGGGSEIGSCSVSSGSSCSVTYSSADSPGTYDWYVVADDSYDSTTTTSQTYTFTTKAISVQDNNNAAQGSLWVENNGIRWASGSEEFILTQDSTSTSGEPGSVWIEGTTLKWITEVGEESGRTGDRIDTSSPGESGSVWLNPPSILHYIDQNSDERVFQPYPAKDYDASQVCHYDSNSQDREVNRVRIYDSEGNKLIDKDTGTGNHGYHDFTPNIASVEPGETIEFRVTWSAYSSFGYQYQAEAVVATDAIGGRGEMDSGSVVARSPSIYGTTDTWTYNWEVPQKHQNYVIRFWSNKNGGGPCDGNGDMEDYTLHIGY